MKRITPILFITLAVSSLLWSCKKDKEEDLTNFDRTIMLQHYADNIILPAYEALNADFEIFRSSANAFVSAPASGALEDARQKWETAYETWMYANSFNFGPAGENGLIKTLVEEIGVWPANTTLIETNIGNGNSSLNDFNRDARGLNAIDYLLFAGDSPETVVQQFVSDPLRGEYLLAVTQKVSDQIGQVRGQWNGSYASAFVSNNGTDVGSSASMMYNEFVKSYEAMKNFKIALPLGLRAGQIQSEPSAVEARYSGGSLRFLRAHFDALEGLWHGRNRAGQDGPGWKEYLQSVTGGEALIAQTEAQLALIRSAFDAIPAEPSLELQIGSNFAALAELHTAMQQHTRFFKSDMSSLLGITITYSSGDGD
jgi:uncharacterized protein